MQRPLLQMSAMTFLPFCLAARLKMDTAQGLHISPIVLRINSLLLPASCVSAIIFALGVMQAAVETGVDIPGTGLPDRV